MTNKKRLAGFLLPVLLLSACSLRPGPASEPVRYNILLVALDAVRADHLGCYGYSRPTSPNIDRFASESIIFERAYSQGIQTLPSFGSFLTGKYPMSLNLYWTNPPLRVLHPEELTLAEILSIHNYRTAAFPTGLHLDPVFGLAQGFDIYSNNPDFKMPESGASVDFRHLRFSGRDNGLMAGEGRREIWSFQDILPAAINYLGSPGGRPFFLMVHSNDAHPPYDNPPEFSHKFDPDYRGVFCGEFRPTLSTLNNISGQRLSLKGLAHNWDYLRSEPYPPETELALSPADLAHITAHYDGAIAYADHCFGLILKELDRAGLSGRTIVILTADHGETLGGRGLFDRSFGRPLPLYEEVCRVPLIIRLPPALKSGISNSVSRVSVPVRLIDLMPTLLDLLSINPPDGIDGASLRPLMSGLAGWPESPAITEALPDQAAFRSGGWKLIYRPSGNSELYRLDLDPAEKNNLINEPGCQEAYRSLLSALLGWQSRCLSRRGAWAVESAESLRVPVYHTEPAPISPEAPKPQR